MNNNIHCRMKWGETEFEIGGTVSKELNEKIDYLYDVFKKTIESAKSAPPTKKVWKEIGATDQVKKNKRSGGGKKPSFYKKAIQRVIDEDPSWFIEKDVTEVVDKLKTQFGVPGADKNGVNVNLLRFFQKGLLTRKEVNGKYLYSITELK